MASVFLYKDTRSSYIFVSSACVGLLSILVEISNIIRMTDMYVEYFIVTPFSECLVMMLWHILLKKCAKSVNVDKHHKRRVRALFELNGKKYDILEDKKSALQKEVLEERYSDVLKKYDFSVGDWGYSQLGLKGLYHEDHPKASFDSRIDMLEAYVYEYCNFGCAYFILKKVDE